MKHFYIEPMPVQDLKYCKASYNTLYGKISSSWEIDKDNNFCLSVDVPTNTSATIIFPEWDNQSILEGGVPISKNNNIVISKDNPSQIKVLSGSYTFVISNFH